MKIFFFHKREAFLAVVLGKLIFRTKTETGFGSLIKELRRKKVS